MSENIFRNFYKNSRDYLVIIDKQGKIIEANNAFMELGFSSDELIGNEISLVFPDKYKTTAKNLLSNSKKETISTFSIPLLKKDNSYIPVELSVLKQKWEKTGAIILVCRDICGQKLSEERFYKIFNANQVLMAISTIDSGIFINVNKKFLKVLGYREDEIIGHSSQDLNLFYDFSQRQEVINQLGLIGKIEDYEVKIRKKSGDMIYCNFSIERIQIQKYEFLLTSAIDISKQKEAEAKIQQLEAKLN